MDAVIALEAPSSESLVTAATRELCQMWLAACSEFLQRERREIIEQVPSPERLNQHRSELKQMLRLTHLLQAAVADPDFPAPAFAVEVNGKQLQLQESWEMLNNPLSEAEGQALIQRHWV